MNGTNALMESLQTDLMLRASNVNRLIGRSKSGNAFLFREEIASSPPIITFNHHPGIRKQGKGDSQESSTYPHPHSHNPHPRKQGMWAGWAELMCVPSLTTSVCPMGGCSDNCVMSRQATSSREMQRSSSHDQSQVSYGIIESMKYPCSGL
ncbi:hypothetical protein H113_08505 [Trichophyton rubrum MR1459]|nr:hypothetical protein H110_08437 [Trichophyton rubrum MR1448]EZF90278.1 hypothetical protein H113_08505 [Trichophyton rubrum MR1459]